MMERVIVFVTQLNADTMEATVLVISILSILV